MARPSQPLILRDDAIANALQIIDEVGLDGFGLDRLASRLKVKTPSLYYHFKGKDEILNEVARLLLRDVRVPVTAPPPEEWVEWFVDIATAFRRSALRHPKAAPLLVSHFPRRFALATYDRGARLLTEAGVPAELHAMIFEGLDKLAFGSVILAASDHVEGVFPGVDPVTEPDLAKAVAANPWDDAELFRQTLRAFLRGIRALVNEPA